MKNSLSTGGRNMKNMIQLQGSGLLVQKSPHEMVLFNVDSTTRDGTGGRNMKNMIQLQGSGLLVQLPADEQMPEMPSVLTPRECVYF